MKLPSPREQLVGCVWLPRILAKARLFRRGTLPTEYESNFCHPERVDGLFMSNFGLSREDILYAARLPESEVSNWFLSRARPKRIKEWNHVATNLGRAGFPMAERFSTVVATVYNDVDSRGMTTVFEVLEADEKDG